MSNEIVKSTGEILLYQTEGGDTKIEVRFENENVWLTQQQLAELYGSSRSNVVEHIKHIYEDGELDETATCRKIRQVQKEGNREVKTTQKKLKTSSTKNIKEE